MSDMADDGTRVTLRMPKKLRRDLQELAKKDRRSLSDSIRLALAQYVADRKTWEPE